MYFALATASICLSVWLFLTRGSAVWLRWPLIGALMAFLVLSALELGLGMITGNGVNDSVFFHLRTGISGGDVSQYAWAIAFALATISCAGGALYYYADALLPPSVEPAPVWDIAVGLGIAASVGFHPVTLSSGGYALRFAFAEQHEGGFHFPGPLPARSDAKNLVMIYLEGLERTYFDSETFPGLITELRALESQATTFTDIGQTIGSGFTVGGMVASQCGTPLILSGSENSMRVNRFLAGAVCLGDLLAGAGYQMNYLGGASIEFAGKGAFYKSHNYSVVEGLEELRGELADPDYLAEWGLQDDTLFQIAQARLANLATGDKPFAMTILTLDTHHPNGHADTNRSCQDLVYEDGSNPMLNSVLCADRLAGQFIRNLQSSPAGKNTVIAVMSDHLALGNTATDQLDNAHRRNLFFVLDPDAGGAPPVTRAATTLDIGPTLLGALGFDTARMGFGVDLLGREPSIVEEMEVSNLWNPKLDQRLLGYRSIYTRLWDFPDVSTGFYANIEKGEVQFGTSAFNIPALLTFDDDLAIESATLGDISVESSLTQAAIDLPPGRRFLWFDDCRALGQLGGSDQNQLDAATRSGSFCAAYGARSLHSDVHVFQRSGFIPDVDLKSWLNANSAPQDPEAQSIALTQIGRQRGEIPLRLELPMLNAEVSEVVVHSAAYRAGPSFVRIIGDTGQRLGQIKTKRGISLLGLDSDGGLRELDRLDNCRAGFDDENNPIWRDLMATNANGHAAFLIVVHDTAFCDAFPRKFRQVLSGLPLIELKSTDMRQPYVGVIDPKGRVFEFPGEGFPKRKVALVHDGGESWSYGYFDPDTVVVIPPEPQVAPEIVAKAVTNTTEIIPQGTTEPDGREQTCLPPPQGALSNPTLMLSAGALLQGNQMEDFLGFQLGWWLPEQSGRWSGADQSQLSLILPDTVQGDLILELGIAPRDALGRTIVVSAFGDPIVEQPLNGATRVVADVSILPRGTPIILDIRVTGPPITCPAALRPADDARQLGFFLKSLRVSEGSLASNTNYDPITPKLGYENPAWHDIGFTTDAGKALKLPHQIRVSGQLDQALPQNVDGADLMGTAAQKVEDVLAQPLAQPTNLSSGCLHPIKQQTTNAPGKPLPLARALDLADPATDEHLKMGPGWWAAETDGRWMGARTAEVSFVLPAFPETLILGAKTATYPQSVVDVGIFFEGVLWQSVSTGVGQPIEIDVSGLPRGQPVTLLFSVSDSVGDCPSARANVADDRFLTLMLQKVSLSDPVSGNRRMAIAHGAGRYRTTSISNSFHALEQNLSQFEVFEIDLNWTPDGRLVCIHDWDTAYTARFPDAPATRPSFADFRAMLNETPNRPRNCDLESLAAWMQRHETKRVVTDVKSNPIEAHALISTHYPELLGRIIPQAYNPKDIVSYRNLGFENIIWTLYRFGSDRDEIMKHLKAHAPSAVAMPIRFAQQGLLSDLVNLTATPLYVHTVNDPALAACLIANGAAGVYSDDLGQHIMKNLPDIDPACLQNSMGN